ncbi:MAG: hypothetical protein Q9169_002735 [Polycauliona sp. 2 TL-2023]
MAFELGSPRAQAFAMLGAAAVIEAHPGHQLALSILARFPDEHLALLDETRRPETGRAGANGLAITLFTEHDKSQSGALINVLKAAGQPVPEDLLKFGTTVKKKGHEAYGAFYKDTGDAKAATKIRFD